MLSYHRAEGEVSVEQTRVHANPTKAFFVHTITRDIKLEDCILDLVDNSVDSARSLLPEPTPSLSDKTDFSKFFVNVGFSSDRFEVTDNCGGISLDDAVNYAFTFGRRENDAPEDYSIGIYGIGMKRAVFKMGNLVDIFSTFGGGAKKAKSEEPFVVSINVEDWLKSPEWDFELNSAEALQEPGVSIKVSALHDNIQAEFDNPTFGPRLRRMLSRDYCRFIQRGLTIRVNDKKVKPFDFSVLSGGQVVPYHAEFMLKNVKVEIIAGMAARPSDRADPDEEGDKEDRSGWYVLCNDRMVVAADKTDLTGWGYGGRNRWHPQYRGFIGIILFSAKEANHLPLTTTKRSIDKDHDVYRLALARMVELTRLWTEYTNKRKAALDEAKVAEARAQPVAAFEAPTSKAMKFPQLTPVTQRTTDVTIQFSKPLKQVKDLALKLGDLAMSAREVGARAFDYAYREMVGGGER